MEYFDVLNEKGSFTGEVKSREECHSKGLWHRVVVLFVLSTDNSKVLLQQRSNNKKLCPGLWDITSGGRVLEGELGWEAVLRETKEEIGIDINKNEIEFIGSTISENIKDDIINRHFNEYYIAHKNIDIKDITLDKEEVQDIKWFTKEEIQKLINNNYHSLTEKVDCWQYLLKYFDIMDKRSNS